MDIRAHILEVAADHLREHGVEAIAVRAIAEKAGTTTQAIYTQFGGKPGLLAALCDEGWRRLSVELERVSDAQSPLEHLIDLAICYVAFARNNPHFYDLMVRKAAHSSRIPGWDSKYAGPWVAYTAKAVHRAIEEGLLAGSPDKMGHLMWATVHGLLDLHFNGLVESRDDAAFIRQAAAGIFLAHAGPQADRDVWSSQTAGASQ